jgi:D-beta-D-heptose 7-phosphate kinase/D-beta-D-heptose 1-phosphate adenosyltransferase
MNVDLQQILDGLGRPRVLVVGDLMLDQYAFGVADRISPEAPVPVLRVTNREERLGGAAGVASMLASLNAEVALVGAVGRDVAGEILRGLLDNAEIDGTLVATDINRVTTMKERFIGLAQSRHPQQLFRVDRETNSAISAVIEENWLSNLETNLSRYDVLLISDYAKGVCTSSFVQRLIQMWRIAGKPVLVDPSREPGYERYRRCSVLTPNRSEAQLATGRAVETIDDAKAVGRQLCCLLGVDAVVVKLDSDGMVLVHSDNRELHFPTKVRPVYDVTGAGDMVLAVLGLCLGCGLDHENAIRLANYAAGIEVEQLGSVPVSRDRIRASLSQIQMPPNKVGPPVEICSILHRLRTQGKRIVFTNGCFDVLHPGHVHCLQYARGLGDLLVVGLNSDASVRRLKGPSRPLHNEIERTAVLASLHCVDYVVVFHEDTPLKLIEQVQPDVLVKGADYSSDQVVGREIVESRGGRVITAPLLPGKSTTRILECIG